MISHMHIAAVVGVLLVAPSTLALGPVELDVAGLPLEPVAGLDPVDVAPVVEAVEDLMACRLAVRLDLHWWGGNGIEERYLDGDYLAIEEVTSTVETLVPVYETTTETVWGAGGLFGFLKPVTREVTRMTGYEVHEETVTEALDLAIHLEWREEYIAWDHNIDTVWVTLPVGLPFVALGDGMVQEVCDDRPILDFVPDPDAGDYDYHSPLPMSDGWFIDLLGIDVSLATPEEAALLPDWSDKGLLISSGTLADRVDHEIETFVEDHTPSAGALPTSGTGSGQDVEPASRLVVPTSTGGALATLGAALAGLVGTAGVLWRRR